MRRPVIDKRFVALTAVVIAVIVYGSLYPFEFRRPAEGVGPVLTLLRSWADRPGRGDFLSNILFYMPLGYCGVIAFGRERAAGGRILLITVLGAMLSASMELTQYYVVGRDTAATDFYSNTLGTVIGAGIGVGVGGTFRWLPLRLIAEGRAAVILLTAYLGYALLPFVPTIDLHKYWDALKPVFLHPTVTGFDLFRHTAMWLMICALIEEVDGPKRSWLWFPLFAGGVMAGEVVVISTSVSVARLAGAALAFCLWLALLAMGVRGRRGIVAAIFLACLVAVRLAPFRFGAATGHFGWIPFLAFMQGSMVVNSISFCEKFFLYGSAIWILTALGLRLRTATLLIAALLLGTSWIEIYLPDRSAEITDALMAILIGGVLGAAGLGGGKSPLPARIPARSEGTAASGARVSLKGRGRV